MMREDYVIAVRTYKRPIIFKNKTFKVLEDNKLLDKLYVFVADANEKIEYSKVLPKGTRIIIGKKGGANAIKAICDYFPMNKKILFMDDDFSNFFGDITLTQLINNGFETIDIENCGAFTMSFISNTKWTGKKPRKELRPYVLAGGFFGTRNDPDLIITDYSHADDVLRTSRYLEKYGKLCLFWKCGFKTNTFKEKGGMQESGDRIDTKTVCEKIYNDNECVKKHYMQPIYLEDKKVWHMKIKPYRKGK